MSNAFASLVLALSLAGTVEGQSPRETIEVYLAGPDVPGEVFAQALEHDQFEYRNALGKAVSGYRADLVKILEYSGHMSLIGAGAEAEDHSIILVALAKIWGDRAFANALASCSSEAIERVQGLLQYGGLPAKAFPISYSSLANRTGG